MTYRLHLELWGGNKGRLAAKTIDIPEGELTVQNAYSGHYWSSSTYTDVEYSALRKVRELLRDALALEGKGRAPERQ